MGLGDWLRRTLGSPSPGSPSESGAVRQQESPTSSNIRSAIEVMLRNPHADQNRMLVLLEGCGFPAEQAWRVNQFLPIACVHLAFRGQGIEFQPEYILSDLETNVQSRHRFADEPLYAETLAVAPTCVRSLQDLLPAFGRSAEYDAILKLRAPDGRFDGIILTEPVLMTFVPE